MYVTAQTVLRSIGHPELPPSADRVAGILRDNGAAAFRELV
jgi:hypothetical protein